MLLLRLAAEPLGQSPQDSESERRVGKEDGLEVPGRESEAAGVGDRHDLGDPRLAVEDRQLAEELARTQDRKLLAVADDSYGSVDDEEEARPDLALPGDHPIGRKVDLDGAVRDGREVGRSHPGEQPAGAQQFGSSILGEGQGFAPARRADGARRDGLMLAPAGSAVNRSTEPDIGQNRPPGPAVGPGPRWDVGGGRMRARGSPLPRSHWMANPDEIVDQIASFGLFADLATPQLEGVAHTFEERLYAEGERILRQGISGSAFHIILEGEATVVIDGEERATLGRGDFFGEVSILLGEAPVADIVAKGALRCLVLAGPQVQAFLVDNPPVMYRMLQAQTRRLRIANRWRS
jgi:Cyclic nucleotide-binding domain